MAQTIRSSTGISSVVKNSTGNYTVNISPTLPNNNYVVQLTGMRDSNLQALGYILGNATYGNSVTTSSLKIQFLGGSSSSVDVLMGNVTILSI